MNAGADFLHWDADRSEICARIKKVWIPIKIALKTKNDPFFIEQWITHHVRIVGAESLIIFDNMSDDPHVLSIYEKYRGRINMIRFAGIHNSLHHSGANSDFYQAIANSSEYFLFIDTDEFLIMIAGDRYHDDERILDFVMSNRNYDLFPATWLLNVNWTATQFPTEQHDLAHMLACGKPLIRSSMFPSGYANHTFQLGTGIFVPPFRTNLFLLHLTRLYPRQRIIANMNKLIAKGIVQPNETPESLAARNDIKDEVSSIYVREIRECLVFEKNINPGRALLSPGCLELLPGGAITYYGEADEKALNEFLSDPRHIYDLIADDYRLNAVVDG